MISLLHPLGSNLASILRLQWFIVYIFTYLTMIILFRKITYKSNTKQLLLYKYNFLLKNALLSKIKVSPSESFWAEINWLLFAWQLVSITTWWSSTINWGVWGKILILRNAYNGSSILKALPLCYLKKVLVWIILENFVTPPWNN